MITIEEIRMNIQPVPQRVKEIRGGGLPLRPDSKFRFAAPAAEAGPVKTAVEDMKAFLQLYCGEDCFAEKGIPVTLELGEAPKTVKAPEEGYRIVVKSKGITITGFGASGLYYGVVSFKQLCKWGPLGAELPAVEVLDWPDKNFRAYKQECRYGSNVMEKQAWLEMIDDLAAKKYNRICVALYGCWKVQYDGKVAEYLYMPIDDYPDLKTPQTVKYYSPTENRWFDYETLPPIYRDNFYGDLVRYAKDRGIDIFPSINSFGHNTLFPAQIPEVSPVNLKGKPSGTGFCTSSEETYKLLFSFYDQVIDKYMTPYGIDTFNILMDEVWDECGVDAKKPHEMRNAWCQCKKCRNQDRGDIFINHTVKIMSHLKRKGMKSILIANDMFARSSKQIGDISAKFQTEIEKAGLTDVVLTDWWQYVDNRKAMENTFPKRPDEFKMRSICCPWNGYYIWSVLTNPMRNIKLMAEMDHESKRSEGLYLYSMWSKSYDRMHDCMTDYAWNYKGTGDINDVTARYVARHFAPMQDEMYRAYRIVDYLTEAHPEYPNNDYPESEMPSPFQVLTQKLTYYNYCYYRNPEIDFPQHFPGRPLSFMLKKRWSYERVLYTIIALAKEAIALFEKAANTAGCDKAMAERMAYECRNCLTLAEDGLALMKIYDLIQSGEQKKIAPIARERYNARISLMMEFERTKTLWEAQGAGMRNHSVHMKVFEDIANYIENTDEPNLNIFDITPIMSKEHWNLR